MKIDKVINTILLLLPLSTTGAQNQENEGTSPVHDTTETCEYFDSLIEYHVFKIPHMIDDAIEEGAKELATRVAKSYSWGLSVVGALSLDIGGDWWLQNRTLGNLFGNDPGRFRPLYGYWNTFESNNPIPYFVGLTHPESLTSCKSQPQDFLDKVDQYQVLNINNSPDPALNFLEFTAITSSEMACLLGFTSEFLSVQRLFTQLQLLFTALQLKIVTCQDDANDADDNLVTRRSSQQILNLNRKRHKAIIRR